MQHSSNVSDTSHAQGLSISTFAVPKMDCPSEERMIRLALDGVRGIQGLSFDLSKRQLQVIHDGAAEPIAAKLATLNLGASLQHTEAAALGVEMIMEDLGAEAGAAKEARTLRVLLGINALMFAIEITVGLFAHSAGLISDSLDNFADASVYGLSLYAVGRSAQLKLRAAHLSGLIQLILALGALVEVVRRFIFGSEPESLLMIGMASLALIANITVLMLIARHRQGEVHMKASWIFTANDVLANIGVILAGVLVAWTGSRYPDLIIGALIGLIVLNGARRILALKT